MTRISSQKRIAPISFIDTHREQDTIERLEKRLADGFQLIEQRRAAGIDVTALEEFWIELLHQYEALCDAMPEAA